MENPNDLPPARTASEYASLKYQCLRGVSKKRDNKSPRWTEKVRVCSETGVEVPVNNDGYSWRKYGQSYGPGGTYPIHYYRCRIGHKMGCLATKRVQRLSEEPSVFEVTYRRKHSCIGASNSASTTDLLADEIVKVKEENVPEQLEENQNQEHDIPFQFGQELCNETETLESMEEIFASISSPSAQIEPENLGSQILDDTIERERFFG